MQKLAHLFILALLLCTSAYSQWMPYPAVSSQNITFVNEQTGWRMSSYEPTWIEKTTNGGISWMWFPDFPGTAKSMLFLDEQRGFVGSDSGRIFCTTDGGITWAIKRLQNNTHVYALASDTGMTVWALGTFGLKTIVHKSTNKGNTWDAIDTIAGTAPIPKPLVFSDVHHGWILRGGQTALYKTVDGGYNWTTTQNAPKNGTCLQFKDSLIGWIGSSDGKISATIDGGVTWTQKQLFALGPVIDIQLNGSELWALGQDKLLMTSDQGVNWDTTVNLPEASVKKLAVFNSSWGYVYSRDTLYHYNKTIPQFFMDTMDVGVDDTLFVLKWKSSLINSFLVRYSVDNEATWKTAVSGIPGSHGKVAITMYDSLYSFVFFDESRPNFPLAVFHSRRPTKNRALNSVASDYLKIYQTGDGLGSYKSDRRSPGAFWKGGTDTKRTVTYSDGLVWAGFKNHTVLHSGGSTHRSGWQPGKINSNGLPSPQDDPTAGVWKLKKNWQSLPSSINKSRLQYDYNNWPFAWGAPFIDINHNGSYTVGVDEPGLIGDETVWLTVNDLDPVRTNNLYGSSPIGIEAKITVFAVNEPSLKNVVFKKYELFNRSTSNIDSMYIGIWSDPDVGDGWDDFVGCDENLNLGYAYNGKPNDPVFGSAPPAVGYALLQGPVVTGSTSDSAFFGWKWEKGYKNLSLSSFAFTSMGSSVYQDPELGSYNGTGQLYNMLQGKTSGGSAIIDPINNQPTVFPLNGNPYLFSGWYEGNGWPGGEGAWDKRMLISCGPITFAPGEKQEFAFAILVDSATNNVNAIPKVKALVPLALAYYHTITMDSLTGTDPDGINLRGFTLEQNYPNPFNPSTVINYQLAESGKVTLKVYDILGNEVITLVNEEQSAGRHQTVFSAADKKTLASGVYFYRLQAGANSVVKKMMLMK